MNYNHMTESDKILHILDIMGAVSAYQGSTAPLPIVGDIHIIG